MHSCWGSANGQGNRKAPAHCGRVPPPPRRVRRAPALRWLASLTTALSGNPAPGSRVFRKADPAAPGPATFPASPCWAEASQRDVPLTLPPALGLSSHPLRGHPFPPVTFRLSHRAHFFPLNFHSAIRLAGPEHPENPQHLDSEKMLRRS